VRPVHQARAACRSLAAQAVTAMDRARAKTEQRAVAAAARLIRPQLCLPVMVLRGACASGLGKEIAMKYAIIEGGKVVNIAVADSALAENWIEAGAAKIGDSWDGETFTTPPTPAPTGPDVDAERDRRLADGVTVNVAGYGDIPIQGRPVDQINTLALEGTARDLIAAGVTAAVIPFRDADNVLHTLTPMQVKEMTSEGRAAASAIYQVAWAMKDNTGDVTGGIPADFTDDGYWT